MFGRLKFFDPKNKFGFIGVKNEKDIFFHFDDILEENKPNFISNYLNKKISKKIRFNTEVYVGKYNISIKAV